MINVHFVSQNTGIIRAEITQAAKIVNVPSEILNKKHTRNLILQKFNKKSAWQFNIPDVKHIEPNNRCNATDFSDSTMSLCNTSLIYSKLCLCYLFVLGICIKLKIGTGFEFYQAFSENKAEESHTFSEESDPGVFSSWFFHLAIWDFFFQACA